MINGLKVAAARTKLLDGHDAYHKKAKTGPLPGVTRTLGSFQVHVYVCFACVCACVVAPTVAVHGLWRRFVACAAEHPASGSAWVDGEWHVAVAGGLHGWTPRSSSACMLRCLPSEPPLNSPSHS